MAWGATLAGMNKIRSPQMFDSALDERFKGRLPDTIRELVNGVIACMETGGLNAKDGEQL